MVPMSAALLTSPRPRTRYCSTPMLRNWPPTCLLLAASRSITSLNDSPYLTSRRGSICTWYCFSWPPQVVTSSTPAAVRRMSRTVQSCSVRRSIALSFLSASSIVYQNTWPRPELLGPSSGSP
jgi:hypothetical protein